MKSILWDKSHLEINAAKELASSLRQREEYSRVTLEQKIKEDGREFVKIRVHYV